MKFYKKESKKYWKSMKDEVKFSTLIQNIFPCLYHSMRLGIVLQEQLLLPISPECFRSNASRHFYN